MADLMGCYPSEWAANRECQELSKPSAWGNDLTFDMGEPVYWFRVEHRVGRGWCVVRRVRGEGL